MIVYADVLRARLHERGAIGAHHGAGRRWKLARRIRARGHAVADQRSAVAHQPRLRRTARPAEPLGAEPIALAE
jgi:hypothetical protein